MDFRTMSKRWTKNNVSSWVQTETQINPSTIKYWINVTWVIHVIINEQNPMRTQMRKWFFLGQKGSMKDAWNSWPLGWAWEDIGVHHGEEGKEYIRRTASKRMKVQKYKACTEILSCQAWLEYFLRETKWQQVRLKKTSKSKSIKGLIYHVMLTEVILEAERSHCLEARSSQKSDNLLQNFYGTHFSHFPISKITMCLPINGLLKSWRNVLVCT